jgi:murein DD-endopeptidase MepM/ murein hydrolase activator NlpD
LQIGQQIILELENPGKPLLKKMELTDKVGNKITVQREEKKYSIFVKKRELKTILKGACSVIETTFASAASLEGIPQVILIEMSNALSSIVNVSKLRAGNYFEVFYEESRDAETGRIVGRRTLKYVAVKIGSKTYRLYNLGNNHYYNEKGESLKKEFLISPIKNKVMRVSSKFGYRQHPILGIRKYHKGVDYVAQYGTEVCASANGVVVKAGRHGSYGLYLKIRHANGFETAYAHLSAIFVCIGDKITQGDVIGRVGRSGRVSGTHLHHEVICHNQHVDPQKYYSLGAVKLSGKDLADFHHMKEAISAKLLELTQSQQPT